MTKISSAKNSPENGSYNEKINPGHSDDLGLAIQALIKQLRQQKPIQHKENGAHS